MRRKFDGFVWEKLDECTYRAKVIGGWVLKTHNSNQGKHEWAIAESSVYIPDKDHEWLILNLKE